jgi:radical SAM superfamily enzyme YgiQ (UPF0313 family)
MFHRSFGLLMIQANLDNPCTLLDFPDQQRFIKEIRENAYDIIGISSIIPNVRKVKRMCQLIRAHQPEATIVVGGHIANLGGIEDIIDADHIVKGDGIYWLRKFCGQDVKAPIVHPQVLSANGARILGHSLSNKPADTAAVVIPSVGCPMGCNFCSTSALFGGKGNFVNFYESGDELFAILSQLEKNLKTQSFFVLDENFLLHRKRALRLLELMQNNNKSWSFYVFSSARVLQSYTLEQLVGLGVSWIWMGLEGKDSQYRKLNGVDTPAMVKRLQGQGIRVLGSTIIGLEDHTPEKIDQVIDYAVSHATDFHQFMLYTANPGTPLYQELQKKGRLLPAAEFDYADAHGQFRFNHRHQHIHAHQEEQFLALAFQRDFTSNGPSLLRLISTQLQGWQRHKNHADIRIRARYAREVRPLRTTYAGAIWAMKKWYEDDPRRFEQTSALLENLYREFGWRTRLYCSVSGPIIYKKMREEERRLTEGFTAEPATFYQSKSSTVNNQEAGYKAHTPADITAPMPAGNLSSSPVSS